MATTAGSPPAHNKHPTYLTRERRLAWLLIAPSFVVVFSLVLVPIVRAGWMSLHRINLKRPAAGQPFVGLENYADIFRDPAFWQSTGRTLYFLVVSIGVEVVIGDQADQVTIARAVEVAGGPLDVICDDGGHHARDQLGALELLWPHLAPGGVYLIDDVHTSYDRDFVQRFSRVLQQSARVLERFRTSFIGKCSPVHFFWGSFDLAVTRFSGRRAPLHPGGVPNLPDTVTREAYSHEVSSAGFWPGNAVIPYPAFYSYAYPAPPGFAEAAVQPAGAFYSSDLSEFILPYEAVRGAADPDLALMVFLTSTYETAASLGKWDRANLECRLGVPDKPRAV